MGQNWRRKCLKSPKYHTIALNRKQFNHIVLDRLITEKPFSWTVCQHMIPRHTTSGVIMPIGRPKTSIEKHCQVCGKSLLVAPSEISLGRGKFCSAKCRVASRKTTYLKECEYCGKEFKARPGRVTRGQDRYCSRACACKAEPKDNSGKNNPRWKGGISFEPYCPAFNEIIKENTRDRFGRTCYLCGTPENGYKLHVHHVDYNKSQGCAGLKWSLIPLCRPCHTKTSNHRHYYFNLLRDYWLNEHIDFVVGFPSF